jgi:putative tryptophan/tyrosine transport system substrate-binding protein
MKGVVGCDLGLSDPMRRREFITLLGAAAAGWPLAGHAQHSERVRRVGILTSFGPDDPEGRRRIEALNNGLKKFGWIEGRNLQFEYHHAPGGVMTPALGEVLVRSNPDIALANSTPGLRALQQATHTIPIVFVSVSDPVGDGFVASLARPSGNITGFSNYEPSLAGKWVELLKELEPRLARVLVLFNPDTAPHSLFLAPLGEAARHLSLEAVAARVRTPTEVESVLKAAAGDSRAGVIPLPDSFLSTQRQSVIGATARLRLAVVYPFRFFAESGGLMSYGADAMDQYTRAPAYIDRILRGEKPGELPVQAPTKFEFVINLKTAKALAIDVPTQLLALADEVIE